MNPETLTIALDVCWGELRRQLRAQLLAWRCSFVECAERLLGYSPCATREKLRVAEALERLPGSARALEQVR